MKRVWRKLLIFLFLVLILSGCRTIEVEKPSLLIKYLNESPNWAGIVLGETNLEDTEKIMTNLDEIDESSIWIGQRFEGLGKAVCVEFEEGFRESGVCIHHIDGIAQGIEFFEGELTIEEVEQNIGPIEEVAVQFNQREVMWLTSIGISRSSGYVFTGTAEAENVDHAIKKAMIKSDSLVAVSLVNPEFIKIYMSSAITGEKYVEHYFEEGGFEDWHGPGEYEVQHWSPFD